MLSRRDATKLFIAGAGFAAAPIPAIAAGNEQWAKRLEKDLGRTLQRNCGGVFSVKGFGQARRSDGRYHFRTAVQLDWLPGIRRRQFDAIEATEDQAYGKLLENARKYYASVWPGCVV